MRKLSSVSVLFFWRKWSRFKKARVRNGIRIYGHTKNRQIRWRVKKISLGSVGDLTLDITVPGNHILDVFEYEQSIFFSFFQDGFSAKSRRMEPSRWLHNDCDSGNSRSTITFGQQRGPNEASWFEGSIGKDPPLNEAHHWCGHYGECSFESVK